MQSGSSPHTTKPADSYKCLASGVFSLTLKYTDVNPSISRACASAAASNRDPTPVRRYSCRTNTPQMQARCAALMGRSRAKPTIPISSSPSKAPKTADLSDSAASMCCTTSADDAASSSGDDKNANGSSRRACRLKRKSGLASSGSSWRT